MTRAWVATLLVATHLAMASHAQAPAPAATVHVKLVFPINGDDIGPAKVTVFKSHSDGQDYAKRFQSGTASGIPYGVYTLRSHQDGFFSAEREIAVYQREVWVVLGLQMGTVDFEWERYRLSGRIHHMPPDQEVFVRLTSIYSNLVADAKVDDSGVFEIRGLLRDHCILTVWSGTKVLHIQAIEVSSDRALSIDLARTAN